jgi:hypothetical protein
MQLRGERDNLLSSKILKETKKYVDNDLYIEKTIPNCSRFVYQDSVREFNKQLLDFVKAADQRKKS